MAYSNVTPPTLPDYSPVSGYSYNGVELPDINTVWTDKETYPYAYLVKANYWNLYLFSSEITIADGNVTTGAAGSYMWYVCREDLHPDEPWQLQTDNPYSYPANYVIAATSDFSVGWTNDTVLNSDGTTFLAASDPVPIEPYPYSVIAYNYEKGQDDWYQAHLYYSATAFTWNGTAVVNSGTTYKRIYDAELDAWTDEAETEIEATPGLDGTVYQRIYTDHDILDSTGAVWLAAGEVTPVEDTGVSEEWLYSFKLGLALGLCGKPLPIARKLIGYSYNGTVLPKLPEWDKSTYPYAFISNEVLNSVVFYALAERPATNGTATSTGTIVNPYDTPITFVQSILKTDGNSWGGLSTASLDTAGQISLPFWANFDVNYADGSVYLAASEPVPVYK